MPSPKLFVSYRRNQLQSVRPAVAALTAAGVDCFLDVEDIDPLADFPDHIREGIDQSHALLAWWSIAYGDSDHCLAELRRAWQHARRRSSDVGRRIWVLNPEATAHHVFAGELNAKNFLTPPPSSPGSWAATLKRTLDSLLPEGPLADERQAPPAVVLRNVPRSTAEFVGRNATLLRVHSKLFPPQIGAGAVEPGVQLHGMGGLGKSEVAAKYAETFTAAYLGGVFWLNLASFTPSIPLDEGAAEQEWLRAVAVVFAGEPDLQRRLLYDADGKALPARAARASIGHWLAETSGAAGGAPAAYLWIVDNVPPMSPLDARDRVLEFWRAPAAGGRTLFTTRDSRPARGFVEEPLEVLDEVSAVRLLARYRAIGADERADVESLVREVGHHTLALTLLGEQLRDSDGYAAAARRLRQVGRLKRLEQIADVLRPELGERARNVAATFELSITPLGADAQRLLGLAAACAPVEPIPRALLCAAFGNDTQADACTAAMQALLRASLLTRRRDDDAVEVHPLVADVAARLLGVRLQREGEALAQVLLTRLSVAVDVRAHAAIAPYVVHARYLLNGELWNQAAARLLGWVARFDQERGAYGSAEVLLRRQVAFYSESLGRGSERTLFALGDLARALVGLERVDEAIEVDKEVLAGRMALLGPEHVDTLTAINNLAAALSGAGRSREALALQEQLLAVRRRVLGPTHEHTLFSLNNYGAELTALGQAAEARPYLEDAYRLRSELYGPDHESTNASASNLADALFELGDAAKAAELLAHVATTRARLLGKSNPKTLVAEISWGRMMLAKGDAEGAKRLLEGTVAQARERLGPMHASTLWR